MIKTKWFERQFPPIEDNGLLPSILERLLGTSARLEEIIWNVNPEILEVKIENKWSIKEEIGHLSDLESLWIGRVEDLVNDQAELRGADLTNQKTHQANHNATGIKILMQDFRKQRQQFVHRLKNLTASQLLKTSQHPHLQAPMRAIDLAFFVAEHDDHHLENIRCISRSLNK